MKRSLVITNFSGGVSPQEKRGLPFSARRMQNLNPFEDDAYLTLTARATKVSGTTVTDLVKWMADGTPFDTARYFYGSSGKIYRETSGGVWSVARTVPDSAGQGLAVFDDGLYYAGRKALGRGYRLSGTVAYNDDFLSDGTTDKDQSATTSGHTYALPAAINEAASHRKTFTPQKDPVKRIRVLVSAKGTGDWTCVVHDKNNVLVGSVTVANANITPSANNDFDFDPPLNIVIGNDYHFHLFSSDGTGTVVTGTANNLETVNFSNFFSILVPDADFHPMVEFLNALVVGNGRYLALWDQAVYDPNRLVLAPGYKVRALTKIDEFLAIGCWRGDDVDATELGRIYFWDGISPTFNFFKDVPAGLVNAIVSFKNNLVGIYGSAGDLYRGSEEFSAFSSLPALARGKKIAVNPGAVANWRGFLVLGVSATDDANFKNGVFVFGAKSLDRPEVLVLGHTVSAGDANVVVGALGAFGNSLYVSWQNGSTYGVDKITKTGTANSSGVFESLIFDDGDPGREKLLLDFQIECEELASGETLTPKIKFDRGSFTNGSTISAGKKAVMVRNKRFKELEFGFELTSTGTYPKVIALTVNYDDLREEAWA